MAEKSAVRPSKLKEREDSTDVEDVMELDETPSGTGSKEMSPEERTVDVGKTVAVQTEKSPEESDATTSGIETKSPEETPSGAEAKPLPSAVTSAPSPPAASDESSPPKKSSKTSSITGAIRKMISPNKKEKVKRDDSVSPKEKGKSGIMSRLESAFRSSKSMSPPDKSMDAAVAEEDPSEAVKEAAGSGQEASPPAAEGSSSQKKSGKLGTKLKKSLSSVAGFFSGNKGSATAAVQDEVGLVVDSEAAGMRTPEQVPTVTVVEEGPSDSGDHEDEQTTQEQNLVPSLYMGCRVSLPSQQESTLNTLLTDVPSIGSDVFMSDENSSSKDVPAGTSDKSDQEAAASEGSRESDERAPVQADTSDKSDQEAAASEESMGSDETSSSKDVPAGTSDKSDQAAASKESRGFDERAPVKRQADTSDKSDQEAAASEESRDSEERVPVKRQADTSDKSDQEAAASEESGDSDERVPVKPQADTPDKSDQEAAASEESRDSDERAPAKRQADTPAEVLKEGEDPAASSSPWKKSNCPESKHEEAKAETPVPEDTSVEPAEEDKMDVDP